MFYAAIAQWNRAQRYERWLVVGSSPTSSAFGKGRLLYDVLFFVYEICFKNVDK